MANAEHLAILKKGVYEWNDWRKQNPDVRPDLVEASLFGAKLAGANLSGADLTRVNLNQAVLAVANLSPALLFKAALSEANLDGADLRKAVMIRTDLTWASLVGAIVNGSDMGYTALGAIDLSSVRGLEMVRHHAPSTIGIDTIYRSKGQIPEAFLRGAGVPEPFIANMKEPVAAMEPIQFYSCFISYSSQDQEFAERLYVDLQNNNVRCWFAPEDMRIGDRIRPEIDEAIRVHDKLLLVLTESSMKSAWVEKEVETAFEKERKQNRTVLFPIRLDDAVMDAKEAWAADIRRTRHIGDFREWKEYDKYKKAFERLMRDLRSGEKHRS